MSLKISTTHRIERFDVIRGILILLMAFNHFILLFLAIRKQFGSLNFYTYDPFGYTTTLEGFIFLSGYLTAKICGPMLKANDLSPLKRKLLLKAYDIYKVNFALVLFTVLLTFLVPGQGVENAPLLMTAKPSGLALFLTLFLAYEPFAINALPLYIFCTFVIYAALPWLKKEKYALLLTLSFLTWIMSQVFRFDRHFGQYLIAYFFNPLSWQFLYVLAFLAGLKNWTPSQNIKKLAFGVSLVIVSFFTAIKYEWISPASAQTLEYFSDRGELAPFRLLNSLAVTYLISLTVPYIPINSVTTLIAKVGRHSLLAFSWHILILFSYTLILLKPPTLSVAAEFFILFLMLSSLYIPIFLFRNLKSK